MSGAQKGYIQATDVAEAVLKRSVVKVPRADGGTSNTPPDLERRDLLLALVALTQEVRYFPNAEEIDARGEYSAERYREEFGDLFAAYEAAGIVPENVSRADVLESDTEESLDTDGSSGEIQEESVDVSDPVDQDHEDVTLEQLQAEIERFASVMDHSPTEALVTTYGAYHRSTYHDHFGSWERALEAAGYNPADRPNESRKTHSDVEVLGVLRAAAEELGRAPTTSEINKRAPFSPGLASLRFGGWASALELAGLEPSDRPSVNGEATESDATHDERDSLRDSADRTQSSKSASTTGSEDSDGGSTGVKENEDDTKESDDYDAGGDTLFGG